MEPFEMRYLRWNKIVPYGESPWPRSGHRLVCNNEALYSFGGYNPELPASFDLDNGERPTPLLNELYKFDFATHIWSRLNICNAPCEVASAAVLLDGSILFVFGGTGHPFGDDCSNILWALDLRLSDDLTFREIPATGTLPPPIYGQSLVKHNTYLYSIGGTDGTMYTMDIHRFDMTTNRWEKYFHYTGDHMEEPKPRYRHEVVVYQDKFYMFGGGRADDAYTLQVIPVFDIKSRKWDFELTSGCNNRYPKSRKCHACIQDTKDEAIVYIFGGCDSPDVLADFWCINLKSMTWTCMENLTLPRSLHFHASAMTSNGRLAVFGGTFGKINEPCPTERTSELLTVWMRIPKLQDIAWEAVTHYRRSYRQYAASSLKALGLPPLPLPN